MGLSAALIVIVLVVFFVHAAIAMVPAYAGYWQVRSIMDRMPEKPEVIAQGPRSILQNLGTQLNINNVRSVSGKDFKLERAEDGLNLKLSYQVREHLIANVDVIMTFDHEVLLETP